MYKNLLFILIWLLSACGSDLAVDDVVYDGSALTEKQVQQWYSEAISSYTYEDALTYVKQIHWSPAQVHYSMQPSEFAAGIAFDEANFSSYFGDYLTQDIHIFDTDGDYKTNELPEETVGFLLDATAGNAKASKLEIEGLEKVHAVDITFRYKIYSDDPSQAASLSVYYGDFGVKINDADTRSGQELDSVEAVYRDPLTGQASNLQYKYLDIQNALSSKHLPIYSVNYQIEKVGSDSKLNLSYENISLGVNTGQWINVQISINLTDPNADLSEGETFIDPYIAIKLPSLLATNKVHLPLEYTIENPSSYKLFDGSEIPIPGYDDGQTVSLEFIADVNNYIIDDIKVCKQKLSDDDRVSDCQQHLDQTYYGFNLIDEDQSTCNFLYKCLYYGAADDSDNEINLDENVGAAGYVVYYNPGHVYAFPDGGGAQQWLSNTNGVSNLFYASNVYGKTIYCKHNGKLEAATLLSGIAKKSHDDPSNTDAVNYTTATFCQSSYDAEAGYIYNFEYGLLVE